MRATNDRDELPLLMYHTGKNVNRATLDDDPVQDWPDWMGVDNAARE
jgi:hypothetical protein